MCIQAHVADEGEIDKSVRLVRIIPSLGMFVSCANTSEKSCIMRLWDKSSGGSEFNVPKVPLSMPKPRALMSL